MVANIEWTEEKIARIRQLAANGMSAGDISRGWNCSRNAIIGAANRNGITLRGSRKSNYSETPQPNPSIGRLDWQKKRRLEENIRRRATSQQAINAVLARARASGELAPLEAVELPAERTDKPRVKLMGLRHGHCRWPIGDRPSDPDFGFCGDAAIQGKPYCANHAGIAYRPASGDLSGNHSENTGGT